MLREKEEKQTPCGKQHKDGTANQYQYKLTVRRPAFLAVKRR